MFTLSSECQQTKPPARRRRIRSHELFGVGNEGLLLFCFPLACPKLDCVVLMLSATGLPCLGTPRTPFPLQSSILSESFVSSGPWQRNDGLYKAPTALFCLFSGHLPRQGTPGRVSGGPTRRAENAGHVPGQAMLQITV